MWHSGRCHHTDKQWLTKMAPAARNNQHDLAPGIRQSFEATKAWRSSTNVCPPFRVDRPSRATHGPWVLLESRADQAGSQSGQPLSRRGRLIALITYGQPGGFSPCAAIPSQLARIGRHCPSWLDAHRDAIEYWSEEGTPG